MITFLIIFHKTFKKRPQNKVKNNLERSLALYVQAI